MYRTWVYNMDGKTYLEVHEVDFRSVVAEFAGWFLVNLSNHVVLDRVGIYSLGNGLINWANDREEMIQIIPLTKKEAKAFPLPGDDE